MQLTDLPNEILMLIVSFLDLNPCTALRLMGVCRRLRTFMSDPTGPLFPRWSAITWRSSNRLKDADDFKLALRLSQGMLKSLSLFCRGNRFHLSKFIHLIEGCANLQHITLDGVSFTEASVIRLLEIPSLQYLHLDFSFRRGAARSIFLKAAASGELKTLSLKLRDNISPSDCVRNWSLGGYCPPDLRLVMTSEPCFPSNLPPPPESRVSYVSVYYQPHSDSMVASHLWFQFQFSPAGVFPLYCSDSQLCVSKAVESSSYQIVSAKYHNLPLEGNVAFSDIGGRLSELDVSGKRDLPPSDLQTFAVLCPNLLQLNLRSCDLVLSDLEGLRSIATNCLQLRVLNLQDLDQVESLQRLWVILVSMSNLRVLYLCLPLLVQPGVSIPVPKLTAISIDTECNGVDTGSDAVAGIVDYSTNMMYSSLEIIRLKSLCAAISLPMDAYFNLTHLYLRTDVGLKMILPTHYLCYYTLQELCIFAYDFDVDNHLAYALSQSKELCVLILHGCSFHRTENIARIATSIETLSTFHLMISEFDGKFFRDGCSCSRKSRAFVESLTKSLKNTGRKLDFRLCNLFHRDAYLEDIQFPI